MALLHSPASGADTNFQIPNGVEAVSATIPFYQTAKAKGHYVGHANQDFTQRLSDWWQLLTGGTLMDMLDMYRNSANTQMQVYDARALEAAEGLSKRDFFNKHGFVLLNHQSLMTADDWLASQYKPLKAHDSENGLAKPEFTTGDTPVKQKYNVEVKSLIESLLPTATDIVAPVRGIQRGPGSAYAKTYASVVHTDFPINYDEFRSTNPWLPLSEQIELFEQTADATAFFILNLWRPVLPMQGPVKSSHLALLHPNTLDYENDFVKVDLIGGQFPEGQSYLHVRHRPEHKWFYYPDMTTDEVLVWKQAHFIKGDSISRAAVPHTAFKDPNHNTSPEPRYSFEHRVTVLTRSEDGQ